MPNGNYVSVVERLRPGAAEPGDIVHIDGHVLGRHQGIVHYTIGQRRGISVNDKRADNQPLYVVQIDARQKRVIVGPKSSLARDIVVLRDMNWLGWSDDVVENAVVEVKLRSMSPAVPGRLTIGEKGTAQISFDEPQFGVAPGQAAVAYQGSRVIGGGWITKTAQLGQDVAAQ